MKDEQHKKCMICNENLEKYDEDPISCYDRVFVLCKNCGPYGYWKENIEELKKLDKSQFEEYLRKAKRATTNKNTPVIELE